MGSRGSEGPDRPSPRVPLYLRSTACSEANSVRHRPAAAAAAAGRSVKVSSLGGSQERKRGTRVVELETKLSKSQAELKKLKERLAEAEAAKVEAEQALAKAKKRTPLAAAVAVDAKAEEETPAQAPDYRLEDVRQNVNEEETVTSPATMDVFEIVVLAEPVPPEDEVDDEQRKEEKVTEKQQEEETKAMIEKLERHEDNETAAAAAAAVAEEEEEEKEVVILKAKLLEKEREVAVLLEENKIFNIKAEEEAKQLAESAQAKQEHLAAQLNSIEKKLKDSKTKEQQLSSQLEAAEGSKATLEMDLKRMKVQIEQWRKAAEAAAEVLASAGNDASEEMSDRILAERCSSMDKYLEADYRNWESPSIDEDIDEDGSGGGWGRRKGAGVRMFGNLWKKNQHK
ncbi:interactor of constitutive active ROPs 4-like [Zingiber officinale]|uniref:interactor of constitutive active ROPs 4-like n=1 Tax=Zingiber officinale TaxID=94328 RepID=UPI001C4C0E12|nr:interactor of constitutive active ROPs 4-like [Zingiber officinale]XP_042412702.1 interactor of constitutive active ROPs 4-like [Zingiber officinale]